MRAAVNNAGGNEREGKGRCGERCRRNRAETEGSAVSAVCRRCRRLASIFLPLHSLLFFLLEWVTRTSPLLKKKCVGVSGALGGAMPRPPSGRTQGSSVLQEQPELWWREEDACVLSRAGVAYCRCGRRRQTRVSAATATGSWRFLYFPCQTFSQVV